MDFDEKEENTSDIEEVIDQEEIIDGINAVDLQIDKMKEESTFLKNPDHLKLLHKEYKALKWIDFNEDKKNEFLKNANKRIKFYHDMCIGLFAKKHGGSFLDQYFYGGDSQDYHRFLELEVRIIKQNKMEAELDNEVKSLFVDVFSLSIPRELRKQIFSLLQLASLNDVICEKWKIHLKNFLTHHKYESDLTEECLLALIKFENDCGKIKDVFFQHWIPQFNLKNGPSRTMAIHFFQNRDNFFVSKFIDYFFDEKNKIIALIDCFLACLKAPEANQYAKNSSVLAFYAVGEILLAYKKNQDQIDLKHIEAVYGSLYQFLIEYDFEGPFLFDSESIFKIFMMFSELSDFKLDHVPYSLIDILVNCKSEMVVFRMLQHMRYLSVDFLNIFSKSDSLKKKLYCLIQDPLTQAVTKEEAEDFLATINGGKKYLPRDLTSSINFNQNDQKNVEEEVDYIEIEDIETDDSDSEMFYEKTNENKIIDYFYNYYQGDKIYRASHVLHDFLGFSYKNPQKIIEDDRFLEFITRILYRHENVWLFFDVCEFLICALKLVGERLTDKVLMMLNFLFEKLPLVAQEHFFLCTSQFNKEYFGVEEEKIKNFLLDKIKVDANAPLEGFEYFFALGVAHEKNRDFRSALRCFKKSEEFDGGHYLPYYKRALIYINQGQWVSALEVLELAKGFACFSFELMKILLFVQKQVGFLEGAIETFWEINEKLPFYAQNQLSIVEPIKVLRNSLCEIFFEEVRDEVNKFLSQEEMIGLYEIEQFIDSIHSRFSEKGFSKDKLFYCRSIFNPASKFLDTIYINEKSRLLHDYVSFLFQELIRFDNGKILDGACYQVKDRDICVLLKESKLSQIYSHVFGQEIDDHDMYSFFEENKINVLTTGEFSKKYYNGSLEGGYLLGYSKDIASTYTLISILYGLIRWEAAYKNHDIDMRRPVSHTSEFLEKILETNKKIVFLVPVDIGNVANNDNVTYKELKWLLESIKSRKEKLDNFILVFDSYNYFPYHLISKINYRYQFGTYLQFENTISNDAFNEKMNIASEAAHYLLSYVIDKEHIVAAHRAFTGSLASYLERNYCSIYWPILEFAQNGGSGEYYLQFYKTLDLFFQENRFDLFFKRIVDEVSNHIEDISFIGSLVSTFFEIMIEDDDFIQYFYSVKEFENTDYKKVASFFYQLKDVFQAEESDESDEFQESEEEIIIFDNVDFISEQNQDLDSMKREEISRILSQFPTHTEESQLIVEDDKPRKAKESLFRPDLLTALSLLKPNRQVVYEAGQHTNDFPSFRPRSSSCP